MTDKPLQIAVVGGGIGGLITAIALRSVGLHVDVFEQAQNITELGAGLNIGPNGKLVLDSLGLSERVAEIDTPSHSFTMYTWNGQVVSNIDPSVTLSLFSGVLVHRGEFITMLQQVLPPEVIHIGKRCVNVEQNDEQVRLLFADGSTWTADAVIGADGIHSVIRSIYHRDHPTFAKQIAYRGLIPIERLAFLGADVAKTAFWIGPQHHFLIFPISRGRIMNLIAFVPPKDEWRVESWSAKGDVQLLASEFREWDSRISRIIETLDTTLRWALYDREPLPSWSVGRVTLLGDAAHAMLPHQGQGAVQSIEDAAYLARCLQLATRKTIPQWLKFYEEGRKPRTTQVQQTTRETGRHYNLSDSEIGLRGQNFSLDESRRWITSYNVNQAFEDAIKAYSEKH